MPQERHGMSKSLEYQTWQAMKQRCNSDPYYVKNSITICEEWINSFSQFYADMGNRPTPNHTLDRINNDLGYSPDNCQWATQKEQANNRTTNRNITYNGITQTAKQWAEEYNLDRRTFYHRLNTGWKIEDALTTPTIPLYTVDGITKTINQWAEEYNLKPETIRKRLNRGKTIEEALNTPIRKTSGNRVTLTHTIDGITKTIKEWLIEYHIERRTFCLRVALGWTITDAIITPSRRKTPQKHP